MFKIYYKFFLILLIYPFLLAIYNFYNFEINIFGDRDIMRSQNLLNSFEVHGYEFGMQNGRRIPGGFYYYYLGLIELISNNILIKNFISSFLSIISFIFLFRLNKRIFTKTDFILSLFFLLTSLCFLQQTRIFWNPSLGLVFSILSFAFFINFFESNNKIRIFLSFIFVFLATQFHISYISIFVVYFIIIIFRKNLKISSLITIVSISFVISYLPYLINFFYPLVDIEKNDYSIIQNASSIFEKDFNIFIWFIKWQLHKSNLLFTIISQNTLLSKEIILIAAIILFLLLAYAIVILLIRIRFNFEHSFLKKDNLIIIALSVFLIFELINFDLYSIIFIVPTFFLIFINIFFKKKVLSDTQKIFYNKFYLLTGLYLLIFLVNNLGYFFTYDVPTNIINGVNRFSLVILPPYAILTGLCCSFIFENKTKKIASFFLVGFMFFHIINSSFFIYKNNDRDKIFAFKNQKEVVDELHKRFDFDREFFFSNVGFLRLVNDEITSMYKLGLEYYINSKFPKDKNKLIEKCIVVIFDPKNIINDLNINTKIDSFFKNLRDQTIIVSTEKFKNYLFIEYKDKNNLCVNNLSNDYILTSHEKKIEKFLLLKEKNKVYKITNDKFAEYYVNLSTLDFILPINLMLKISTGKDILDVIIVSKALRNSSTKLNGFWDEVNFHQPKLIFKNLETLEEFNFLLTKKVIGNKTYRSPINYSNLVIPEGEYQIILEIKKINSFVMKKEIDNVNVVLDKNFNLNYSK